MIKGQAIVADSEMRTHTKVSHALVKEGFEVQPTKRRASLLKWLRSGAGNLLIIDESFLQRYGRDETDHVAFLRNLKAIRPEIPMIVTGEKTHTALAARVAEFETSAYLIKPIDLSKFVSMLSGIASAPISKLQMAESRNGEPPQSLPLVGRSAAMQEVYRTLGRLVQTDLTVLITGETGTGKELIAHALHDYGRQKNGPFVALSMTATPRELIETELFGLEIEEADSSDKQVLGRLEQAQGGTLFLDEIGDMPINVQTRLLRVLQQGEYMSVGGRNPVRTNARVIASTSRDLRALIQQGLFREDLFFRLNVVPLRIPPLRERLDDIPALVQYFFRAAAAEGLPLKQMSTGALERLKTCRWPGNVRELENLIRRIAALYPQEMITEQLVETELGFETYESFPNTGVMHSGSMGMFSGGGFSHHPPSPLAPHPSTPDFLPVMDEETNLSPLVERYLNDLFRSYGRNLPPPGLYQRVLRELEEPLILAVLSATRGNQIKAADLLGVNRNTLRKKIKELDIRLIRSPR